MSPRGRLAIGMFTVAVFLGVGISMLAAGDYTWGVALTVLGLLRGVFLAVQWQGER